MFKCGNYFPFLKFREAFVCFFLMFGRNWTFYLCFIYVSSEIFLSYEAQWIRLKKFLVWIIFRTGGVRQIFLTLDKWGIFSEPCTIREYFPSPVKVFIFSDFWTRGEYTVRMYYEAQATVQKTSLTINKVLVVHFSFFVYIICTLYTLVQPGSFF